MPQPKDCPNCRRPCPQMAPECEGCGWDFIAEKLPRLNDDRIRPPYPFFGSKRKVADDLWRLFGGVKKYIEPFLGSAAMLRHKPHCQGILCVVNDRNRYIANFWRAVQHAPEEVARLCDWPVNEADLHARHAWLEAQPFEEAVAETPGGNDLLERIRNLERGLQSDPLWHDPLVAAWWCWGQCAWIGGDWCARKQARRSPDLTETGGVHRRCRQVEIKCGGVLRRNLPPAERRTESPKRIPGILARGVNGRNWAGHRQGMKSSTEHGHGVNGRPEMKGGKGVSRKRPIACRQKGIHGRRRDLTPWFERLQACLQDVVVSCGDWGRVVTPCVLGDKPCAVFLDPPYKGYGGKCYGRYNDETISARVRLWAVQNGENPNLRIALCEYEGVFDMPPDWSCYRWDHPKGMSTAHKNRGRERVWCSPGVRPLDRLERLVRVR